MNTHVQARVVLFFEQGSWHFPAMQRRSALALRQGRGGHKGAGLLLAEGVCDLPAIDFVALGLRTDICTR